MNWQKLWDIKEILNYLTKVNGYFLVFIFPEKTNYNLINNRFYLNYDDVADCVKLLSKIKQPPFEIVLDPHLKKHYEFERQKKILRVQKITGKPLSPFDIALTKAEQIVFGSSQSNLNPFEVVLERKENINSSKYLRAKFNKVQKNKLLEKGKDYDFNKNKISTHY